MSVCGFVNLYKPAGITSRRAIDQVKRLARPAKVGHTGTLDPLATGVLVVCVGPATRLTEYVQRMSKRYVGTFLLGRTSATEDIEGEVTELADPPIPTLEQIVAAKNQFIGRIEQRPPAYSAIRVAGQRAYDIARRGQEVDLPARSINIYEIEVKRYEYPELVLEIECGGGTYIRSLGRDLAESLGSAAVMSALTRTAVGDFRIEQSVEPDVLNNDNWTDHLLPPLTAVERLAQIKLTAEDAKRIGNGQSIEYRVGQRYTSPSITPKQNNGNFAECGNVEEAAALDSDGRLAAILRPDGPGRWRPKLNLPTR